jgi:hypothetical protein
MKSSFLINRYAGVLILLATSPLMAGPVQSVVKKTLPAGQTISEFHPKRGTPSPKILSSTDYSITTSTGASIVPGTSDTGNYFDDGTTLISLPFSYQLYDTTFTSVEISSNGTLQFNSNNAAYSNSCLPNGSFSYTIFPFWDDLYTADNASGEGVFTSVSGSAPNRIFNIEWRTVYCCTGGAPINDFEIRLYEGQTKFDVIYGSPMNDRSSATVGIQQNSNGDHLTQYSCNAGGQTSGLKLTFEIGGCTPVPGGLIGWWPGDGNALDIQNGNNGTLHNGVAFATGEVGKAFSFDGVDDYVAIPDSPLLNYSDFTYDAWIAPDASSPSGDNYIICKGVNGTYLPLIYISGNNGSQYWRVIIDGGTLSGGTVTYGFQHVAVTRQGSTGNLYVDGVLVDTETVGPTAAGGYQLVLGKIIDFPSNLFKGKIDELEVFNTALSQVDIQSIYNAGSFGKCKPQCVTPPPDLVSWWTGDNTSIDIQGGNNLSLGGATFVAGKVGQAFNFDGTQAASAGLPSNLNITGNQVTIDGWVNLNATQTQGVFFGKSESGQNDYALFMLSSQLAACIRTSNGFEHFLYTNSNPSYPSGFVPPNGQWTHIAMTYDGANEIIYVNGAEIARQSVSGNIRGDNVNFWVGGRSDNLRINAAIDEVEVFSRALTSDEILAIYNAGTFGKCKTVRFFVSNENANTIDEFDDAGNYAAQFAPVFPNFGIPAGLSFDFNGNLTVNYQLSAQKVHNGPHWATGINSTVQKFDPLGNPTFFADIGFPQGNAFDLNGNLYVAEYNNNDIREFDPSANGSVFVDSNSGLSDPFGVAFSPSTSLLFVSNEATGTVLGFDQSQTQQQSYSGFNSPTGLAFDINGNLYVAELSSADIIKIDTGGNTSGFASTGDNPVGLVFDLNGNLYVTNYGSNTIYKIDSDGNSNLFASQGLDQPTFIAAKEISPTAAVIQFYPANYTANESDGSVTLTVTRNGDVSGISSVNYSTFDGTAVAGTDYTAASDTLSFGSNETSKTIQVSFLEGNPAQEDHEPPTKTFTVTLSNAVGAMLSGPATSTVSVSDDDANSEPEWSISVSASPSGVGTVGGGGSYRDGSNVEVTASSTSACYQFVSWTEGGNVVSNSATYDFTASSDRTLVANFAKIQYNISASAVPSNGGSVSGAGNYDCGATVQLTATPTGCATFSNWTEGSTVVSTSQTYSFTASSNRTLVAHFLIKNYTISASASPSAGGTITGAGTYSCGSTVNLVAKANTNYQFTNWTQGNTIVSTSANYSFPATASRTLVAHFTAASTAKPTVKVAVSPGSIKEGQSATYTITVTPANHAAFTVYYQFTGKAKYGTDFKLNAPLSNMTIPAFHATATITLTSLEDNGVNEGTEPATFMFNNNPNYNIGSPSSATVNIIDD